MKRMLNRNLRLFFDTIGRRSVALCAVLLVVLGLGLSLTSGSAQAGICFLPDCQDKQKPEADNSGVEECRSKGYESDKNRVCPTYSIIEYCPENTSYIKCDEVGWCNLNGYTETVCELPEKLFDKCPNSQEMYKECKLDDEEACKLENPSYVSICQAGWTLDPEHLCSLSPYWGLCCNMCPGYNYTAETLPEGSVPVASCDSCDGKKFIIADEGFNQCTGFWDCQDGCAIGSETCVSGGVTKCKTCKRCEAKCDQVDCPYGMDCDYENCTQRFCIKGCKVGYTNYCKIPIHDCALLGYDKTPEQCGGSPLVMCPYDKGQVYCMPDDGVCCEVCKDFEYQRKDIPAGYEAAESCSCCGKTLYKIVPAACDGYQKCPYGKTEGANPCQSGEQTLYNECKECPNACPENLTCPKGTICEKDSCSGTFCAIGCSTEFKNYCKVPNTDCKDLGYSFLAAECNGQAVVHCPYDPNWGICVPLDEGDCCRNCKKDFPYQAVPEGYTKTGECKCCDQTYYQAEPTNCDGFLECEFGGADGATSCRSEKQTYYSECKECPNACEYEVCPLGVVCVKESCSGLFCASGCVVGYRNYCGLTQTNCDQLGYHSQGADCVGRPSVKCPYDRNMVFCPKG